jgi:predicted nucleic acid-binding protein
VTTLVFDGTALNHFAKAGRLTELGVIVEGYHCVAPAEVFAELTKAVAEYPALGTISAQGWLGSVELGEIAEIVAFAQYKHELGGGSDRNVGGGSDRNVGESAVLAWVAVNGGIAIIDEAAATSIGDRDRLAIRGSMWLVIRGYKEGKLDRPTSEEIVDDLIDSGMWLPVASGAALFAWAYKEGLLP